MNHRAIWAYRPRPAAILFAGCVVYMVLVALIIRRASPYYVVVCVVVFCLLCGRFAYGRERSLRTRLSQMAVLGGASLLLLSIFGLVDYVVHDLLDGSNNHEHVLVEALAILPPLYMLDGMHDSVERWLENILFRAAHDRERALADFVRRAVHFTVPDALFAALVSAIDHFTNGAGSAVYMANGGDYRLKASSLVHAPLLLSLDANRRNAIARGPSCRGQAGLPGIDGLVLPMCHRGDVQGLVVVGLKGGKDDYRPDECERLAEAVHQIGLDLDTVHVDSLEARIAALTRKVELEEHELSVFAGRRSGLRPVGQLAGDKPLSA